MTDSKILLKEIRYECLCGEVSGDITQIVYDSRKIIENCIFVCLAGVNADGHDYIPQAIEKKAAIIIVSVPPKVLPDHGVTILQVEDTRYALAFLSAAWFDYPADKLKTIGITGTKGKTTSAYFIQSILEKAGYRTGLIGTIETVIGDEVIPAVNTTPESYVLQEYFHKMVSAGLTAVVMEVSSQGLKMHRTQGFTFDLGIFTNLEPDHIGPNEHESFEDYKECKSRLFKMCRIGIVNCDDENYREVIKGHTCELETYGMSEAANLRAADVRLIKEPGSLGTSFTVKGLLHFQAVIENPGYFNVYNALCAIAVCRHFQVPNEKIQEALLHTKVKGRIEMVPVSPDFTLLIDYAHNAMALKNVLSTLRAYEPNRLICLFGCGGNRSRQRRFEMGEISAQLADLTIVTSDNPRFEEPSAIIEDILVGVKKAMGNFVKIPDRKQAIAYAIENGKPGDIIILAGKGHEDYQEIKGVKYPMDERVLIREILQERQRKHE